MEALKCIKCGEPVSRDEFDKRYQELLDRGFQPMMVVMCKPCRNEPDEEEEVEFEREMCKKYPATED